MRILLAPLAAAAFVAAVLAGPIAPPRAAAQEPSEQTLNAAGVVIDTGTEVRKICVRFPEAEISGEELLRRAEVQAVFAEYSIGTAVCALCGTGCPADDCFCESTTTGRYWNYSRGADATWQRSSLGASSTTVADGDVDGWAWGTEGATPPWSSFDSICVETEAAPALSSPPTTPASVAPAASRNAPAQAQPPPRPSQRASATPSPTATPTHTAPPSAQVTEAAATEPTTSPVASPASDDADEAVLAVETNAASSGSGLGGVLGFAGAGGLLGAALLVARRRVR